MKRFFSLIFISTMIVGINYAQDQGVLVMGVVKGIDNNPLTGVSVTVQGYPFLETITDTNGMFVIRVPRGSILVFSYIGYVTRSFPINTSAPWLSFEVILWEDVDFYPAQLSP